jgi:hypothetical protein
MKYAISNTLFIGGIVLLGLSSTELVSPSLRMWLAVVAVICEGSLAQYVVREHVRDYPGESFLQNLLPATLPAIVLAACVLRVLGAFGSPIFT